MLELRGGTHAGLECRGLFGLLAADRSGPPCAPLQVSFAHFLTANLIPVTLGNIVGGALFVATAYSFIFGALGGKK